MRAAVRPSLRGLVLCAVLAVLATMLTVLPGSLAGLPGDAARAADPLPTAPSAIPLPTVQIDGVAWQQLVWGDTVYVGGSFRTARPAGAPPGSRTVVRQNVLAYDLATGRLRDGFVANTNGQVLGLAMAPDGSRLYLAGEFTGVNGSSTFRLAAVDPGTGRVDGAFRAQADFRVRTVLATASTLYLGGAFGTVNGQPRGQLAAVNRTDGRLLNWAPRATGGQVMALEQVPGSGRIVAAGAFTALNGVAAMGMGALDAASGATLPFPINTVIRNGGSSSAIYALDREGPVVYGNGYLYGAVGNFEGTFATNAGGDVLWINDIRGDQYDVHAERGMLFSAGHAHQDANLRGGFPQERKDRVWNGIVSTAAATGTLQPSNDGKFNLAGQPAPTLLHWFPEFAPGSVTGLTQATWTVAGDRRFVVFGGEFPAVNGVAQQGLVRFAFRDTAAGTDRPRFSGPDFLPRATSPGRGLAQVSFRANWDRDDASLSYQVQREGAGTVATYNARSSFHTRPVLTFHEGGLPAGGTVRYRLVATDPGGQRVFGDWVALRVSTDGSLAGYAREVLGDRPSVYWRLGEPSGDARDAAFGRSAVVGGGVQRGVPGALAGSANTASRFAGSGQAAWSELDLPTPREVSTEAWIRTTTRSGGLIVAWADTQGPGTSGRVDYATYLGDDGRVRFGVVEHQHRVIVGPAVNDGRWHHIVATLGWDSGQQLYVDGRLVASNTAVKHGRDFRGYWRIGSDNLANWRDRPSTDSFEGDIDEVATYLAPLPAAQVAAHHAAGRSSGGTDAAPSAAPGFSPITPVRLADTRATGRIPAGGELRVPVAGRGGLPGDASAVSLNVTVTGPAAGGFVTVHPCGTPPPLASNLNFSTGQTVPNAVLSGVGTGGAVCLRASAATHLVVDANGSFARSSGFAPVVPARLADTRSGAPVAAGAVLRVRVAGRAGVGPGAGAASLNVTATAPRSGGYVTVFPCDSQPPLASNLNFLAGQTVPNAVLSGLGPQGDVCLRPSAATHLIVDVNGAFAAGAGFLPIVPERLVDTRTSRAVPAGGELRVTVVDRGGVHADAAAVSMNVTATGAAAAGWVTVYPCGAKVPPSSNLNMSAGRTVPNAVLSGVGAGGQVCLRPSVATHLIVDLNGGFRG
jgi:hypothetical protein